MQKTILSTAAFLGFTAVILGAWGSHGLKTLVPPESVASFETGVRYQMYHSLFLLFIGIIPYTYINEGIRKWIFRLTLIGVICFSFSIYLLATNSLTSFFDFKKIALVTPLGGLFLITAWGVLFISLSKQKK